MTWQGKFENKALRSIIFDGTKDGTVLVQMYDNSRNILRASGTTVPTDATAGYAKGCVFIKTDASASATGIYENVGTTSSCDFDPIGQNTTIADDAVSLENLDDGITPSHVTKYAGEFTWTGSGASVAHTVTGALATDIVVATIQSAPTEAAYLVSAAVTADTVTITLSAANTSNDAVISYIVMRAAA